MSKHERLAKEALELTDPFGTVNWYFWRPIMDDMDTVSGVVRFWDLRRLTQALRVSDFKSAMRELEDDANNP